MLRSLVQACRSRPVLHCRAQPHRQPARTATRSSTVAASGHHLALCQLTTSVSWRPASPHPSLCSRTCASWLPGRTTCPPHNQQHTRAHASTPQQDVAAPGLPADHTLSLLKLLGVTLLWGTYSPVVRMLFLQDAAPPVSVLTAAQACLSSILLLATTALSRWLASRSAHAHPSPHSHGGAPATAATSSSVSDDQPPYAPPQQQQPQQQQPQQQQQQQPQQQQARAWPLWLAGAEQGLWMFAGAACHTLGLTLASTTAASFLLQASAILTPALSTLAGDAVSAPLWLASTLGFFGSLLIAYQAAAAPETLPSAPPAADGLATFAMPAELAGLSCILVACTCYAASTLRLGVHCRRHPPLHLSAATSATYALLSVLWVVWDCWHSSGAILATTLQLGWQVWAAIAWLAIGPGAAASFLQTDGQRGVDPATAQVVYLGTPLWSSLIAGATMKGEGMDSLGWVGGSLILVGSCIAAACPQAPIKDAQTLKQ